MSTIKKISPFLLLFLSFSVPALAHASSNATWTDRTAVGTRQWSAIASSPDGTKLVAAGFNDYLYTSTTSGLTWATSTSAGIANWNGVTISSDGQKISASTGPWSNGLVYASTNGGSTWTTSTPSGLSSPWAGIAGSSDGSKLITASWGDFSPGYVYTSTTSGATWATSTPLGRQNWWTAFAYSADGSTMAAATNSYIYLSTDNGATWATSTAALGTQSWTAVGLSDDGSKIIGSTLDGKAYISTTTGSTWALSYTAPDDVGAAAISGNGNLLAIGIGYPFGYDPVGDIYISADGGINWVDQSGETDTGPQDWAQLAFSDDGTKLVGVAGADGGPNGDVWTAVVAPPIILVSSITISATGSTTSVTNGGTLQMNAAVLPSNAANKTVLWSVTNGTGSATIDSSSGLLTATGVGTVTVTASSTDGSNISGTEQITVTAIVVPSSVASGGRSGGGSVANQVSNLLSLGNTQLAQQLIHQYPTQFTNTATPSANVSSAKQQLIVNTDLSLGLNNQTIKQLQIFLNNSGFIITKSGAGSPGNETTYFGKATRAALIRFQTANNIFPASGYFGPKTRALIEKQ